MAIEDTLETRGTASRKRALGYVIGLLLFVFLAVFYDIEWRFLIDVILLVEPLSVIAAVACFALHGAINAIAYCSLQRSFSNSFRSGACIQIWMISLPGKYLPGGFWSYVSRAAMLRNEGVPLKSSVAAMTLEQVMSLTIVTIIAVQTWLLVSLDNTLKLLALFTILVAAVFVASVISKVQASKHLIAAFLWYLLAMIPYLLGYLFVFQGETLVDLTIALFASTATGMITVIVPGGLGVREAGLIAFMPNMDSSQAASYALLSRATIVFSEFILAGFAYFVLTGRKTRQ